MHAEYVGARGVTRVDWMSISRHRFSRRGGLGARPPGHHKDMVLLALVAVPATIALLIGLLVLSAVVEDRVLHPRALIVRAARVRSNSPEFTESFVAREFERLLRTSPR